MKLKALARAVSLISGLIATVPGSSATPANDMRLTIRVLDYADLPPAALAELEANAKRILRQAGVAVDFVECFTGGVETRSEACGAPLGPFVFNLRILEPRQAMKGEQLGYAAMSPEGGAIVTVFLNPAQRKARVASLSDPAFLGHAVAHEVGHLLLGPNAHSSSGVMRPVMRESDEEWMARGLLLFSADQARRMQARLRARLSR
ncbi:MAG: hypothetical protein JSU00_11945 [Acidobacteria bacterium]|nr:hypothetical protein [Acidobacteriota bacterium]